MAKPLIVTIDDDFDVLRVLARDLRQQFGQHFRILPFESGSAALAATRKLKLRMEPVALFLADQRMPSMSGIEFLEESMSIFPEARRALLTAYADTEVAILAINRVKIHYYLMKPWNPPNEQLFPAIQDMLDDWLGNYLPPFEGLQVVGHRWSQKSHQLKSFLMRNHIPYRWLNAEVCPEAARILASAGVSSDVLPFVLFTDGTHLIDPTPLAVAQRVGLKTQPEKPFYDLVIIGAGPAGLAAAVYGASEGLHTVMIEREAPGGQAGTSSRIENYLGFPSGLSGQDLARRATVQARRFGVEVIAPAEVVSLRAEGLCRFVRLADGTEICCSAVVIATGVAYNRLLVPGLDQLVGTGVYYGAAATEALSCSGDAVCVVGAGNSAGQAAIHLAKYARTVDLIARGESLERSMSRYLIEQIDAQKNICVYLRHQITAVVGTERLESFLLQNLDTEEEEHRTADALFIFIGATPHTEWLNGLLDRDARGFILTGQEACKSKSWQLRREPYLLETSLPGVFAAGDARYGSIKRVATSVGEGAIAVQFIHTYLEKLHSFLD